MSKTNKTEQEKQTEQMFILLTKNNNSSKC